MKKPNQLLILMAALSLSWACPGYTASCNSRDAYFTAVKPFNEKLASNEAKSSVFSDPLCGQQVSIASVSGQLIDKATLVTTARPDGSVIYAEDIVIKVADQELFRGRDFTEQDLERLLQALGSEIASAANIAQTQQVNRQTYNTISAHLMQVISRNFSGPGSVTAEINKMAASADASSPDSGFATWAEVSYSDIEDDSQEVNFNTDLFQLVAGLDKRFGNLIVGSTLNYAYADNQQTFRDYYSNSIGIAPYVAYKVSDFMFLSGVLGYNYTDLNSQSAAPDSDLHEFTTEGNINLYKVVNSFIFKGRIGVRYTYADTQLDNGRSGSSDSVTAIGDLQIDYLVNENILFYIGSQYEYLDRNADGINAAYQQGVFYFRSGLDYAITNKLSVGAAIETDLSDHQRNLIKGGINFRLAL